MKTQRNVYLEADSLVTLLNFGTVEEHEMDSLVTLLNFGTVGEREVDSLVTLQLP
jgi:hypothetical protein